MSKEQSHTPGPWLADDALLGDIYRYVLADNGTPLARIDIRGSAYAEGNARLIAAAPDLLAALERCLRFGDLLHELAGEATAAIAKARGE